MRNCAAIAIDHHFSYEAKGGVDKKYKRKPTITKDDYAFIHTLSNWHGGPINIFTPFILCLNAEGDFVSAPEVIGNDKSSYRLILPQTILYTTLRNMKEYDNIAAQSQAYELSSQPTIKSDSTTSNDITR